MNTPSRPWLNACLYLAILGPLFFLMYGGANQYAAALPAEKVGQMAFAWEKHIPLLPWTILPYWSIDLMYAISLFMFTTRAEIKIHALRLLSVMVIACTIFVLYPLRFSWERPPVDGLWGMLFTALAGFDKPFNQAPSLHIALLVVIWHAFKRNLSSRWQWPLHGWCALIGISVLTTWQHHFLDVPTGFALGVIVCFALPFPEYHASERWLAVDRQRALQLARWYGIGATALATCAFVMGSWAWLLLWPAIAAAFIAAAYAGFGPVIWQKQNGRHSGAARWAMAPVLWLIHLLQKAYHHQTPPAQEISDGVWIGPVNAAKDQRFVAVLDLTTEHSRRAHADAAYAQVPMLDLLVPNPQELSQAVSALESLRLQNNGPVLVHCALGLTRSAAVLLAWLVKTGRAQNLDHALEIMRERRDAIVLSPTALSQLNHYCQATSA